jgi:flagellar motor switch protein FliG
MNQTGGLKSAADMLNALERTLSQSVLNELDKRNPDLCASIREKMFTFEDLALLDKASLQKILREVDTRDVAIALKSASDKLRTTLLAAVSKRAAETISEEISFLGPLKKKEMEAAQQRIIESVRHLEAAGEVDLSAVINPSRDELMA